MKDKIFPILVILLICAWLSGITYVIYNDQQKKLDNNTVNGIVIPGCPKDNESVITYKQTKTSITILMNCNNEMWYFIRK